MLKKVGLLALSLLLSGTIAWVETTEKEPVTITITWWGGQSRHDYTQQLLDLYTAQNPHVTFEAVPSGWDGYFDKLATSAATGSMPDIVQMDYMYIATYTANGTLADMASYYADSTIDVSSIDANILGSGMIDGKNVDIPLSTSIMALSYNPAVLEDAGVAMPVNDWTWAEFKDTMVKIAETSNVKDECAAFINWFVNREEANAIIMGERGTPTSASIREWLIASGTLSAQQIDMFNYVDTAAAYSAETPAADPSGISEINRTFKDIAYSVFYGQSTPEKAAEQFRAEVNAILAANN